MAIYIYIYMILYVNILCIPLKIHKNPILSPENSWFSVPPWQCSSPLSTPGSTKRKQIDGATQSDSPGSMVNPQDPAIRVKILWIWHLFSGWSLAFRWSWSHGWQFGQSRTYMQNHANLLLCMYTKLDKYTNPRVDRIWMNVEFPNILTKITKMDFSLKILFSIYFRMITIYIYIYMYVCVCL